MFLVACYSQKPVDSSSEPMQYSGEDVPYLGLEISPISFQQPKPKTIVVGPLIPFEGPNQLIRNPFKVSFGYQMNLLNGSAKDYLKPVGIKLIKINPKNISQKNLTSFQYHQFYRIEVKADAIIIKATNESGISMALAYLSYQLNYNNKRSLEFESLENWPDIEKRMLQIYLKGMKPKVVENIINRAWLAHYNQILFSAQSSVKLKSLRNYAQEYAMPSQDFKRLFEYSRLLEMEPIPDFNLLSHQSICFTANKAEDSLLFNQETIKPKSSKAQILIKKVIGELDSLVQPKAMLIGFDEVVGLTKKQVERFGKMLPAQDYLNHLKFIYKELESRNIKTMIWGDMLLHAEAFPEMYPGPLNGTEEYANLIDQIPKKVIICDWHYRKYSRRKLRKFNYDSFEYFLDKGFEVYGATFDDPEVIDAFTKKVYDVESPRIKGMIATTWHRLLKGSITKHRNDSMKDYDAILEHSAEAFWNASKIKNPPYKNAD
jgi:hypothetical protein